jgi:hypothetical protein
MYYVYAMYMYFDTVFLSAYSLGLLFRITTVLLKSLSSAVYVIVSFGYTRCWSAIVVDNIIVLFC